MMMRNISSTPLRPSPRHTTRGGDAPPDADAARIVEPSGTDCVVTLRRRTPHGWVVGAFTDAHLHEGVARRPTTEPRKAVSGAEHWFAVGMHGLVAHHDHCLIGHVTEFDRQTSPDRQCHNNDGAVIDDSTPPPRHRQRFPSPSSTSTEGLDSE
jgi:hypothetical protein